MRVALTGATGYLGGFVLADLRARGCEVRAWVRSPRPDLRGVAWLPGDLGDFASMRALVTGCEALVHLAYHHRPGRYRRGEGDDLERYLDLNLMGGLRLLEIARRAGVSRAVVLSSRAVYPHGVVDRRLGEDDPVRPDTHYGAYKAALEAFAMSFAGQSGWHIAALRPTGVYGLVDPPERSKWFALIRDALAGGDVTSVVRGGTEVHGADVADAIWRLLTYERAAGGIFNCSDLYVTTREVVSIARRIAGIQGPLPAQPEAPPASVMDTSRLEALGWRPGGRLLLERTLGEVVHAVSPA